MGFKKELQNILFIYTSNIREQFVQETDNAVSLIMFKYLDVIYLSQSISPSQLASEVGVSRAATSKMIARLSKKGYVLKNNYTGPRCPYTLSLTPKALSLYHRKTQIDYQFIEILDKHLNLSNIAELDNCLNDIYKELKETYQLHSINKIDNVFK